MPDIAMCPSQACPIRSTCRRNEASGTTPSGWQSWMDFDAHRRGSYCNSFYSVVDLPGEPTIGQRDGRAISERPAR